MKILIGLKGPGLSDLVHTGVTVSSSSALTVQAPSESFKVSPKQILSAHSSGTNVVFTEVTKQVSKTYPSGARIKASSGQFTVSLVGTGGKQIHSGTYQGELIVESKDGGVVVLLESELEKYVQGVLRSEIPAAYNVEAMKAQAVLARSYALRPRIDHSVEGFNVCDSFLCCQAFNGIDPGLTDDQRLAISSTQGRVLTYQGKPALALFSASAGGHTEDYCNCFSNLKTNKFPDDPIPYLKGVPEGSLPSGFPSEAALRKLWNLSAPATADAWSPSFKWKLTFNADQLESHMHHVIEGLTTDPQFRPFINAPKSGKFGHIQSFAVTRRGVSGVAMDLEIKTSAGSWIVQKELTIRSVFANPELKLKRLRSGRIFFDEQQDRLGLLSGLTVYGLGFGHGVGLQQTGAQGLALKGMNYEHILQHYYPGAEIGTVT